MDFPTILANLFVSGVSGHIIIVNLRVFSPIYRTYIVFKHIHKELHSHQNAYSMFSFLVPVFQNPTKHIHDYSIFQC